MQYSESFSYLTYNAECHRFSFCGNQIQAGVPLPDYLIIWASSVNDWIRWNLLWIFWHHRFEPTTWWSARNFQQLWNITPDRWNQSDISDYRRSPLIFIFHPAQVLPFADFTSDFSSDPAIPQYVSQWDAGLSLSMVWVFPNCKIITSSEHLHIYDLKHRRFNSLCGYVLDLLVLDKKGIVLFSLTPRSLKRLLFMYTINHPAVTIFDDNVHPTYLKIHTISLMDCAICFKINKSSIRQFFF